MEKLSPCQLAFPKSVSFVRSCPESLTRNFADSFEMSLASLTWISLSFLFDSLTFYSKSLERCNWTLRNLSKRVDRLPSLTLHNLSLATGILQSLILESWSFAIASLILYSLSFTKDRLQRLTLQSLSLKEGNGFEPLSFKEVSFGEGTEELDKSLAHNKMKRKRAATSSSSRVSFEQRKLAQEAGTNSFAHSLSKRILSFRTCLQIFLLGSFQLVCAALLCEHGSFRNSFSEENLQPEKLAATYSNKRFQQHSFQRESLQQDELTASCCQSPTRAPQLVSLQQLELSRSILDDYDQLDLEMSLSFPGSSRNQLQEDSFCRISSEQMEPFSLDRFSHQLDLDTSLSLSMFSFHSCSNNSFEQRALHCAALLFRNRFSRNQLQNFQLTEQQLTGQQLYLGFVSGGASETRASTSPLQLTALTLISLSLAFGAWLKSTSQRAWKRRTLTKNKCTASLSTTSPTSACQQ